MKIFKVSTNEASYDEYKSIVVVAENDKRALEIAKEGQPFDWKDPQKYDVYWLFTEEQHPLKVTEINLTKEAVIASELIGN